MGVDLFFAISGLLITSQLLEDGNLRRFYIRRAFRILPPALLYLGTVLVFHLTNVTDVLHCLLFLRNYGGGPWYTGHFWSLSLEEQFYLIWPLLLICAHKRANLVAVLVIAAVCAWRTYAWTHGEVFYVRTEQRCDGLLWGCLSAFCLKKGTVRVGPLLSGACLVAGVMVWSIPGFLPVMPMLLSLGILGTVQNPQSIFSRALESKPLVWIGQRSYGIYLWQELLLFLAIPLTFRLVLVFLWPSALYRWFETPLRKVGRSLAGQVAGNVRSFAVAAPLQIKVG